MDFKDIFIISTNRSDYGLLQALIKKIHFSNRYKLTVIRIINKNNISLDETIKVTWNEEIIYCSSSSRSSFESIEGLIEINTNFLSYIKKYNPKLIIVLGDRYELLPIISQALLSKIPIAHISGGEITEGAIDDKIRNMVSFSADIHLVAHNKAKNRLKILLGNQNTDKIFVVGEPGLEEIKNTKLKTVKELSNKYKLNLDQKYIICTLHPETNNDKFYDCAQVFFEAISEINSKYPLMVSYSNNDPIGFDINKLMINKLSKRDNTLIMPSFGQLNYWSLLSHAHCIIGNSSSGLVEAPFLGCWTIDVGERQTGRVYGETVKRIKIDKKEIKNSLSYFLNKERSKVSNSPYGNGNTVDLIFRIISKYI